MTKPVRALILACIVLSIIAACQNENPSPTPSETATHSPIVESVLSTPSPSPPRNPDVALVQGTLILLDPVNIAPQEDGIYLVPVDTDANEGVSMVVPAVDPKTSLQAEVDESDGQFYFTDVSADIYALVAMTENSQQLSIREFKTGKSVIVTVKEEDLGQTIDLGTLRLP
jgi:hypothetical protein